ncbi:MAG TPA: TetR family transcriptional regulator [Geminicoccaceae bacterium]|nr:TetR family transcriptional regulator [Geminicoccaceae bacterium]
MPRKRAGAAPSPDLLAAAYELIAERGWGGFSMAGLAEHAGVSLVEVYRQIPSRTTLLRELGRRADEAMLSAEDPELATLPPRDRAFELVMRRLDALAPYKPGLRALARGDGRGDPLVWLVSGCNLDRAMGWLREAIGLGRGGLRGAVAKRALGLAYVRTVRVWLDDDSPDLARTMAELDRNLRRIEGLAGLGGAGPGPASAAEDAAPAT